jgi:hypothetical protein
MELSGQLQVSVASAPGAYWTDGWVGLRVGMDAVEKGLAPAGNNNE